MSDYNPNVEVYYCKQSESPNDSNRIVPAPMISIAPEIYYVNDNVAGYTYTVTLNGYANALRKELDNNDPKTGLKPVIDHIGYIRKVFNVNGGNLHIQQQGSDILVAKGATIKSFNFTESENKWVNYAPFTIEIEFNEIDFIGCAGNSTIDCESSLFHANPNNNQTISDKLIDIKKYKIKTFNDKWNISIEDSIYQEYKDTNNNTFRVSYDISATGKHYYKDDQLIPAWEQARNFVQDRLYKQVKGLLSGMLLIESNNNDANNATKTIQDIHDVQNNAGRNGGILENFPTDDDGNFVYDVYNETISCQTSESDGSFSATYNALIKKKSPNTNPDESHVLHTFTKSMAIDNGSSTNATITIQGTVTGLIKGGLIYYENDFTLPQNGKIFIKPQSSNWDRNDNTKYKNATNYFYRHVKNDSDNDLKDDMKLKLNITNSQLLIKSYNLYPKPASFTVDHNYHEGTIAYTASYDRSLAIAREHGFVTVSITRNDPTDITQEFIIPGRLNGPIVQRIGAKNPRTVSVSIEGAHPDNRSCVSTDICNSIPFFNIPNYELLFLENPYWVKTKEDYTVNNIDGSYSISLEFMVRECP